MYGLMIAFDTKRETLVAGGHNTGLNFVNVVADSKATGTVDTGGVGSGVGRKMECWNCGGDHLKRNFPNIAEEKEKQKKLKYKGGKWCIRRSGEKCTKYKTEVKGGQLHTIFRSSAESTSGAEFRELGEGDEFM